MIKIHGGEKEGDKAIHSTNDEEAEQSREIQLTAKELEEQQIAFEEKRLEQLRVELIKLKQQTDEDEDENDEDDEDNDLDPFQKAIQDFTNAMDRSSLIDNATDLENGIYAIEINERCYILNLQNKSLEQIDEQKLTALSQALQFKKAFH